MGPAHVNPKVITVIKSLFILMGWLSFGLARE
jgi:hypothetical protein